MQGSANTTTLILYQGGIAVILCIDVRALKTSPNVQKDVNLEDLLKNHVRYYDSEEEAIKDNFVPLNISVAVRSMYSNLVAEIEGDNRAFSYYVNITNIEQFIHKGYDLLMYLTSICIMHMVDYKKGFDELMLQHSQFCPIGIYNPDPAVLNPIIVVQIIMSDCGAEKLRDYLKGNVKLVPVNQIAYGYNIKPLLDEIIEVKEDSKNEQHNHN